MLITRNARKHGIGVEEIRDVLAAPLCSVPQGAQVLHIGVTPERDLIEVVVLAAEPRTVLHAMRLRPSNYEVLATAMASRHRVEAAAPSRADPVTAPRAR